MGKGTCLYDILVALFRPYTFLFLCFGLALAALWIRRRETARRLLPVTLLFVGLALVSTPALAFLAVGSLEWRYHPLDERPPDTQAIVILAAGLVPPNPVHPRAELDEDALYRCLHGAKLYHQGPPCPVLVSGGKVDSEIAGPTHARVMADFLEQLSVRPGDIILEEVSQTTNENAVECGKVLHAHGLRKVILITDAVDMWRAELCFLKQEVEVRPSACHYRAAVYDGSVLDYLPSPGAARTFQRVGHEWLGIAWYWMRGRI
jgi:uncharacterized SAM-binding protein YcdF (DUF218 family)